MEHRPAEIRVRRLQRVVEPPGRGGERVGDAVEATAGALRVFACISVTYAPLYDETKTK
jgi:hypothetical protein